MEQNALSIASNQYDLTLAFIEIFARLNAHI